MSINRVNLTGRLTRDPELRSTSGGTAVLAFSLAVNDRRRDPRTGEWEDVPNFVDCTVFGRRAESLQRFLAKGSLVAVDGRLRYSSWEKDGQRRSKLEVVAEDIELMGQPPQQRAHQRQQNQSDNQPQEQPLKQPLHQPQQQAQQQAPQQTQQHGVYPPGTLELEPGPEGRAKPIGGLPWNRAPQTPDLYEEDVPF